MADSLRHLVLTRRALNRWLVAGAVTPVAGSLLAACGGDDDDDDAGTATAMPGSSGGGSTAATATSGDGGADETAEAEPEATEPESAATTPAESTTPADSGDAPTLERIIIAVGADVATLDPINEPTTNFSHLRQSFENLIRVDENLEIQPALAVTWEMVDDTTWDFVLREGTLFHNGEPVTAEDVVWCLNTMLAASAESGPRKLYVAWLESAEVVDDETVRLNTLGAYPAVLASSYVPLVIPKAHYEAVGAEGFNAEPVGTGPYRITSWSLNQQLEMEAFADYWGEPASIPNAMFRIIPEESTRINEAVTGGVQVVLNLSPTRVPELQDSSDVYLTSKPSVLNFYLGFNTHNAPFDNVLVRRAIAHALDVPLMIQELLSGYGQHANSLVHSTSFGWDSTIPLFEYDPDQAIALLEEAGYGDGFDAEFLAAPTVWPVAREAGEAITGFLAEVGINAQFQFLEWGDYFDRYRNSELSGLFLWGNSSPGLDPQNHLHLNFHSPPDGRGLYWSSPDFDALLAAAQVDLDETSRAATLSEAQWMLHDDVAAVPLWQYEEVVAVNNAVSWQARGDFYIQVAEARAAE